MIQETTKSAVGNLAINLGMQMTKGLPPMAVDCFVESVLVLAFAAGVPKQEALLPFDVNREQAQRIWEELEDGSNRETQRKISEWADKTFGSAGSNARVAARANEEMAELLRALTVDDQHPKAAEEVADIVIVLYRLATRIGINLHDEIDRKMEVNRKRVWNLDKTGHGYHVRDKGN